MFTVTKSYRDLPAAHRQPNHDGHCRLIHGHNWGFDIVFACRELDENGFVVDVGKLRLLKDKLAEMFDHTLLLNSSDPLLPWFRKHLGGGDGGPPLAQIVVVPNCGMEGLARNVCILANDLCDTLEGSNDRGLRVTEVVCWEDGKNSARYFPE